MLHQLQYIKSPFYVKSCYFFILDRRQSEELDSDALEAVKKLWWNDVLSKVTIFGLRLLLDRLST
jgi:hypothetical protein